MGAADAISKINLGYTNVDAIRERYSSNPFKVNGTNELSPVNPAMTTEIVENVKYNSPKARKDSAYEGFYSPMYGKPNYNGQRLDIMEGFM